MKTRHFLSLMDLSADEFRQIVARAAELRAGVEASQVLRHQAAAMVFEKSSTRTRVSFEAGIAQMGGSSIFLAPGDSHLQRGEPLEDTARVLSRMVKLIIMRTGAHERVVRMAEASTVPVINALSDFNHPCQLLADIQTCIQYLGDIRGNKIAWIGDGNNVCHSWMNAARLLDFQLYIASPDGYGPEKSLVSACGQNVVICDNPDDAVADSSVVVTDCWISMGQERERRDMGACFEPYQVNESLMAKADREAIFMHCLPAYRGSEVSAAVIDGPQSVVWDEAENRLHAQKALMEFLLNA
ncbi:MAG: ornithine carbamoyltransferase [Pseudomonadota bacterium]